MKKKIFILLSFSILLFSPNLVLSDCLDLGGFTGWKVQGDHTILFYRQNSPIAKVNLKGCTVTASSTVRLTKSYVCDSDSLIVDGQECAIMTITSASSQ
jgi:hypothetical protein